jgi:hypothetical protein
MKTALVCIAKNEDHYIKEWIDYHIKLEFDHVFVYANDWKYSTDNNKVSIYEYNGFAKQLEAYNDFVKTKSNGYNWAAFFDVDEFLVLKKHNHVKSFLQDYNDYAAIGINWALFGDSGHKSVVNGEYSVLKRFTHKGKSTYAHNNHIKSIVKLPTNHMVHIHNLGTTWHNLNKEPRTGPFNTPVDWSIAQLNHYLSKTKEELFIKCNRGRADTGTYRKFEEHLEYLDLNDEEDVLARNFLYEEYKENI